MERLALLAGRRGDDDRDVARRFALTQAQYQSPGFVACQDHVEQNRSRLRALERALSTGYGTRDDGLIAGTAEQPLYREAIGEIVIHDQDRHAGRIERPLFLPRFDNLGSAIYPRHGHRKNRTLPWGALDRDTAAQQLGQPLR